MGKCRPPCELADESALVVGDPTLFMGLYSWLKDSNLRPRFGTVDIPHSTPLYPGSFFELEENASTHCLVWLFVDMHLIDVGCLWQSQLCGNTHNKPKENAVAEDKDILRGATVIANAILARLEAAGIAATEDDIKWNDGRGLLPARELMQLTIKPAGAAAVTRIFTRTDLEQAAGGHINWTAQRQIDHIVSYYMIHPSAPPPPVKSLVALVTTAAAISLAIECCIRPLV